MSRWTLVEMLDIEFTGGSFKLPARDGNRTVSYALGILTSMPIQGILPSRVADVIAYSATQLQHIARRRVEALDFEIGQTIFWVAPNSKTVDPVYPEGWPSLYALTAVAFPDSMHME